MRIAKGIHTNVRNGKTRYEARVTIPATKATKTNTIYVGSSDTISGAVQLRNDYIKDLL